jgi:hypothetical protein
MFKAVHHYALNKPIAAIIAFSIAIRLLLLAFYCHVTIFPDSEGYADLAALMLKGSIAGYEGYRSPGYPALLALLGNCLPLVVALQMALGVITAVYTYKIMRLLSFGTPVSFYMALVLNSLVHVLFYETNILTESVTLFFTLLCFYHTFKLLFTRASTFKQAVLLSFLLGVLAIIKPFYIFMPFLIYGLYTLKNFSLKTIINTKLVVVVFPLAAFLGWSYVNKVNTGYFVSSTYYGINIAQNCVWFAEDVPPQYKQIGDIYARHRDIVVAEHKDVAMTIWFAMPELQQATGLSQVDLSHELAGYSKSAINQNPGAYAKQAAVSFIDFWGTVIYWNYDSFNFPYANKAFLLLWFIESFTLLALKIIFAALMPWHVYLFFKNRVFTPALVIVIVVLAAALLQALATYGTNNRFSYPFEFLMVITLLLTFKHRLQTFLPAFFNKN